MHQDQDVETMEGHPHSLKVKNTEGKLYKIQCDEPRTVMELIKSSESYQENSFTDGRIVVQLGEGGKEHALATHFPCSCIRDEEMITLLSNDNKVEASRDQCDQKVHSKDKYSVFYIDTVGGKDTKSKKLFINTVFKTFKYLRVYGEKGITVEEALKRDGRFLDLGNFELCNIKDNMYTTPKEKVDGLHEKKFKICLPRGVHLETPKIKKEAAGSQSETKKEAAGSQSKIKKEAAGSQSEINDKISAVLQQRGTSVTGGNIEEISKRLREQYPDLKRLMESRFSGLGSYEEALELRREDFGKIEGAFSEVHRIMKMLELGKSVCKVIVEGKVVGTGFVLFDNFILTNAHLFIDCIIKGKLREDVYFTFNYVEPEPHAKYQYFKLADRDICYNNDDLDYAIVQIEPYATPDQLEVPPGLLKKFGQKPANGHGCILGHPGGALKKMDPICIIEKENREQAVISSIGNHRDDRFVVHAIKNGLKKDPFADVVTYNTFMYHGASGSPVFDVCGRVFGLHTSGFHYGFNNSKHSLIEFAQPLLNIFKDFVSKLDEEKLKRVEEETRGNHYLEELIESVLKTERALPDVDSPMEID
ncbi:serine protease FAM111A isoform X2 [Gasterosteus aculeatus]